MEEKIKLRIARFELLLVLTSLFAFSFILHESSPHFGESFDAPITKIIDSLSRPLIPIVSAQSDPLGCCELAINGDICSAKAKSSCSPASNFAENAVCDQTAFCSPGCCYNPDTGEYDKGVKESLCPFEFDPDPHCNIPGAQNGCCILENTVKFNTLTQCEIDTEVLGQGDLVTDWQAGLNEAECLALKFAQDEGACVLPNDCKRTTGEVCTQLGGDFAAGFLCTADSLGNVCEKTQNTACVADLPAVYFFDSCGNHANVYDSSKVDDSSYWQQIIPQENSCNADSEDGNANNPSCGNCNQFEGGFCASSSQASANPDIGSFICKDISCDYMGQDYENGESWCVYESAIGNGDDVPGSSHYRYVCNQGVVDAIVCGDGTRSQICEQSDTVLNGEVIASTANCVINNAKTCILLNTEDGGLDQCSQTLHCHKENVNIDPSFDFDVCLPDHPQGSDISIPQFQATQESVCAFASQNCTVVRKPKTFGGCSIQTNGNCLQKAFGEEMNEFCRQLGDCGAEVNIAGDLTKNYEITNSPDLSNQYLDSIKALMNPVPGQVVSTNLEEYETHLAAMGIFDISDPESGYEDVSDALMTLSSGVGALAYAGALWQAGGSFTLSGLATSGSAGVPSTFVGPLLEGVAAGPSTIAGFAGVALGAAIGVFVGAYVAEQLGLSPFGSILLAVGGGLIGISASLALLYQAAFFGPFFWVGIVLAIIGSFFGGSSCDPIEVQFECKPWQPPIGGDMCDFCNGDPLKPCTKYRCQSLGTSCELVNVGTSSELCIDANPNDVTPPTLSPQLGLIADGIEYKDITDSGFSLASSSDACIPANSAIFFSIKTDEPAYCKYDFEQKSFEDLNEDLGGNYFVINHTEGLILPEPDHINLLTNGTWNGQLEMFVQCIDTKGNPSLTPYNVNVCVKEGLDISAPLIKQSIPSSGSLVSFDSTSIDAKIIVEELASCRWSLDEAASYDLMTNSFSCDTTYGSPSSPFGYVCEDSLPFPTNQTQEDYFVRCADQPWFIGTANESQINAMEEPYKLTLFKPAEKISISSISPSEDFEIPTPYTTVELVVNTADGGNVHTCEYSFSGFETMISFFETGSLKTHSQQFTLDADAYTVFVRCTDETGDFVESETTFEVIEDDAVPQISSISTSAGSLEFSTTEPAECRFSTETCKFKWSEGEPAGVGLEHSIAAKLGQTYHIKCEDEFGNVPSSCQLSLVVA